MTISLIADLTRSINEASLKYHPMTLANEGWLHRIVLDWFEGSGITDHPLSFTPGSMWFSEAKLPSAFLPRSRGDPQSESHTDADGAIGEFEVGRSGKADPKFGANLVEFYKDCLQFNGS